MVFWKSATTNTRIDRYLFFAGLLAGTNGTNGSYGSSLNALGLTLADLNSNQFAMPQSPPANSPLYFLNNNNNNNSSNNNNNSRK